MVLRPDLVEGKQTPAQAVFRFPGGLRDFLIRVPGGRTASRG